MNTATATAAATTPVDTTVATAIHDAVQSAPTESMEQTDTPVDTATMAPIEPSEHAWYEPAGTVGPTSAGASMHEGDDIPPEALTYPADAPSM